MVEKQTNKLIRVIGLSGSLRAESITRMAVQMALQGAQDVGAQVQMLDLNDYDLMFEPFSDMVPSGVVHLRQEVRSAQGIILGTPEYHGSFSGVLKHALDLMGFKEFEGKMIGLVGVAGGKLGGADALNSLRSIGRTLHAWVVPKQVAIPEAWKLFDDKGDISNQQIKQALLEVGHQVARFAYLHQSEEAREFLHMWEAAPPNPGG
jgi:NAD(P)H-dependent FMN reductase